MVNFDLGYHNTTIQLHHSIKRELNIFLAKRNLTKTRIFNAFVIALLTGDIVIQENNFCNSKLFPSTTVPLSVRLGVTFVGRDGKPINVTGFNENASEFAEAGVEDGDFGL